jgi:hypothetical protein
MDIEQGVVAVLVVAVSFGLIAWLAYRLMRWARASRGGAQVLGAVLSEVTQASAVHEAKQGKKRKESDGGDPPDEK